MRKHVVTKITKDNLAEDGNRYGTQEVRVQVKSGAYAGEELEPSTKRFLVWHGEL